MLPVVGLFVSLLCGVAGDGKGVYQKSDLLLRLGHPAQIHCSHNLGGNYLVMFWYRKTPGGGLEHILSTTPYKSRPEFEETSLGHVWAEQAEAQSGYLTLREVRLNDTGVYWCAAGTIHGDGIITRMDQTPADAIKAAGDDVIMSCNYSSKRGLNMIWYKQTFLAAAFIQVAGTGVKNVVVDADVYRLTGTRLRPSENGQDVTQKPADIVEAAGHSVTIECTYRIPDYDTMLWYRQRGRGMQLIGAMYYDSVTMEPGQDDVQLTGSAESGETCKMVIPALHWSSSAVYYCAARTTVQCRVES